MKINLINSVDDYNIVEKSLIKSKKICIDTEFVRENTYYPILSLVQLNINNEIFILDCYDKQNLLEKLTNILINNDIVKIFHDCEQDIEILQSNLNINIKNIFISFFSYYDFVVHGCHFLIHFLGYQIV